MNLQEMNEMEKIAVNPYKIVEMAEAGINSRIPKKLFGLFGRKMSPEVARQTQMQLINLQQKMFNKSGRLMKELSQVKNHFQPRTGLDIMEPLLKSPEYAAISKLLDNSIGSTHALGDLMTKVREVSGVGSLI